MDLAQNTTLPDVDFVVSTTGESSSQEFGGAVQLCLLVRGDRSIMMNALTSQKTATAWSSSELVVLQMAVRIWLPTKATPHDAPRR